MNILDSYIIYCVYFIVGSINANLMITWYVLLISKIDKYERFITYLLNKEVYHEGVRETMVGKKITSYPTHRVSFYKSFRAMINLSMKLAYVYCTTIYIPM